MAIEEQLVDAYNDILSGKQINVLIGDWSISNLTCPSMIDLEYKGDAFYGFVIGPKDNHIQFYNYHRKAKKGTGTLSLKELESSFSVLAKNRNQEVISVFNLYGQKDTEVWLKKNNYILTNKGEYQKVFEHNNL